MGTACGQGGYIYYIKRVINICRISEFVFLAICNIRIPHFIFDAPIRICKTRPILATKKHFLRHWSYLYLDYSFIVMMYPTSG